MTAAISTLVSWPIIEAGQIDFYNATPVISAVQKFVVPVPEFADGGELLVYPQGDEHCGEPILAWDKTPVGDKGVVFWNTTDRCWQAAASDGAHVVIVNDVSEHQAGLLYARFADLGGPERITLRKFKDFLAFAAAIGLTDTYQSETEYVKAYMIPVRSDDMQIVYAGVTMGFVKRDDCAVALACYMDGSFQFINAAGVTQEMPDGGVIIQLGDAIHAVQPDVFRQTYCLADHGRQVMDCTVDIASTRLTDTQR